MTDTTKDLIERARFQSSVSGHWQASQTMAELADALERLTQPVGVEPITSLYQWSANGHDFLTDSPPLEDSILIDVFSAETVARLQAELASTSAYADRLANEKHSALKERDALQEQVKTLRDRAARLVDGVVFIYGKAAAKGAIEEMQKALAATGKEKS